MKAPHLTLREAVEHNRLSEFIAQEEARGSEPADEKDFEDALKKIIKPVRSDDQTSHLPSSDGSSDSQTRQGT